MKLLLKLIKYTFITILSVCLISILYFVIGNKLFLESKNESNIAYLKKNKTQITNTINDELFDSDFYKSNVFLLGEIHGYADNQKADKEFLFFLNKKLGVKYYIAEMDSLTAKKLNSFLSSDSKNETILKDVVLSMLKRIPQQSSQELFDKWSEIYDYNQKLADSLKLTVIGIDTDFDGKSKIVRDKAMAINFKNYVTENNLENEKFYGLFGFFHTLQDKIENGAETFASALKKSGNKVTTLLSFTLDSEMYLPKNLQYPTPPGEKIDWVNADGPLMLVKGINDLKELSLPNSITLFKLNSDKSPYFKSKHFISIKSRFFGNNIIPKEDNYTTDYFQYIVLLRNSKSLTKLK